MKIKVWETSPGNWRADPVDLPGWPVNGVGPDRWAAVGSLLFAIRHENATWTKYNWPHIEIVNEKGEDYPPYTMEEFETEKEDIMPKINGKFQRCECGCNVFRWIKDTDKTKLKCNSCKAIFSVER